jgi:hypothetical protein
MTNLSLSLGRAEFLLLVPIALAVAFLAYRGTVPRVAGAARRTLTLLRGVALLLLLFALCEPVAVLTSQETARPVVALLVDASRSMEIADGAAKGDAPLSRREAAARLLGDGGLRGEISERHTVVPFLFGREAVPGDDPAADLGDVAEGTDIAAALGGARQSGTVDAVVLLTDGVRTAGGDPVAAARALGRPVYAIGIGDPTPARDLAVTSLLASEIVYTRVPSPVVATLRGTGFRGTEVEAVLRDGQSVLGRQTVRFPDGSEVAEVRFAPALEGEGLRRLTLSIPERDGEVTTENNAQSVAVKVLGKKIAVLLLFGRPEHDLPFLRRALAGDEGMQVDAWFADARGVLRRAGGGASPPGGSITEETLFPYDVLVIGSPTDALFQRFGPNALGAYLERREGALVLLAGDQGFRPVPDGLWALLPVARGDRSPALSVGPVAARLTLDGENHPLTRLLDDPAENRALWTSLPPLSGIAEVGAARPDAQVLVAGVREGGPAGGADAGLPLLVLSRRAGSRVLLVAGRGVWRWEFLTWGAGRSGDAPARLWSSAVRWLVSRDEFKRTEVRPEAPAFRRGERVRFFGRSLDESFRPVDGATLRVVLTRSDDPAFSREVALAPSGPPGEHRGAATDLPPGLYRYRGEATRAGLSLGSDEGEFVVSERSAEFEETPLDEGTLRAVAEASGGRYLHASEYRPGGLGLRLEEKRREVRREIPLWNHPALYLAVVRLFVAEWFLRKRRDLP